MVELEDHFLLSLAAVLQAESIHIATCLGRIAQPCNLCIPPPDSFLHPSGLQKKIEGQLKCHASRTQHLSPGLHLALNQARLPIEWEPIGRPFHEKQFDGTLQAQGRQLHQSGDDTLELHV